MDKISVFLTLDCRISVIEDLSHKSLESCTRASVHFEPVAAWYSLSGRKKESSASPFFFIMTPRQHQHYSVSNRTADTSQHEKISSPVYCQISSPPRTFNITCTSLIILPKGVLVDHICSMQRICWISRWLCEKKVPALRATSFLQPFRGHLHPLFSGVVFLCTKCMSLPRPGQFFLSAKSLFC